MRDLERRVFSADGGSLGEPEASRAIRERQAEASAERRRSHPPMPSRRKSPATVMSTVNPTEATPEGMVFRQSSQWNLALDGVFTACDATGTPFVVQAWTGG